MWSTFFVTDEEGRTVVPGTAGAGGIVAPAGPAQGAGGLASLMGGRSTFGGKKRRRTTSTGHAISEAQEGKDPLTHLTIETERQKALEEIAASMRCRPVISSTPLSTEGRCDASAPGFTSDWPSSLLPTPDPDPEGSVDEPPSQSVPVYEGFETKLSPPWVLVSAPEELEIELPPLLVPVPILEELEDKLPTLPVPVREGCKDALPQSAVPQRLCCKSPGHSSPGSQQFLSRSLGVHHGSRSPELHRRFPRGFPPDWLLRGSSTLLSRSTDCSPGLWVSPGRPAGRLPALWVSPGRPPARPPELWVSPDDLRAVRLNSGSHRDDLRAVRLNSGSHRDDLRVVRLNSGSHRDDLRAVRLNSVCTGCPPSPPPIKLAFFVAIVGVVLTVLGVGTEFWVELAPPKNFYNNQSKPQAYAFCPPKTYH
ncbi:hypothetical protein CRENBAI_005622 [Crenichthys baileyi]|uniref:Uncharacterized protein n=1 Tax=Crenichthys baileyi TaxID=28760 RepID=A0AAV9RGM3_9TELE